MAGDAAVALRPERPPRPARAVGWLAATDHKRTAAKVAVAATFFFGLSGLLALFMRAELAQPGLQFVSDHTYDELFTMHGSGMIYLFLTPAALGLGLYFVPLQVGAAEVVAPRLALLDWMMPGLDGIELCHRIRGTETLATSYVMLLTAKSARVDLVAGLDAGADDYMTKPIDP